MFIKDNKKENRSLLKRILYDLSIIVISVSVLYIALAAYAGNLIPPPGPVASTMRTIEDIYKVLADPSYVSGAAAKSDGNVLEILKCITAKMNGGVCS